VVVEIRLYEKIWKIQVRDTFKCIYTYVYICIIMCIYIYTCKCTYMYKYIYRYWSVTELFSSLIKANKNSVSGNTFCIHSETPILVKIGENKILILLPDIEKYTNVHINMFVSIYICVRIFLIMYKHINLGICSYMNIYLYIIHICIYVNVYT
jgi:hypothetical protein